MGILTGKSIYRKGITLFFLMTTGFFVGYLVGIFLLGPVFNINLIENLSLLSPDSNSPLTAPILKFLQLILVTFIFIIPANIFAKLETENSMSYFEFNATNPFFYFFAIAVVFIASPFISYLSILNERISFPESLHSIEAQLIASENAALQFTELFLNVSNLQGLILNIFIIAVVAAISEELIFRGIVQKIILEKTKNIHLAIWISAFIFSAFHLQFFGFFPRLILGALLGYSFYWSRSIYVPILLHFTNNATAVIADYCFRNKLTSIDLNKKDFFSEPAIILSFILSIVLVWFWNSKRKRQLE